MEQIVKAIFEHGVLKPVEPLSLPERERVEVVVRDANNKVTVEPALRPAGPRLVASEEERQAVLAELFDDIERANLHLSWHIPTRDELYDRF